MGRDRGKGKGGRGGGRGGGKMFIANVEELQMREMQISEARNQRAKRRGEDDDEEDDDNVEGNEEEEQDPDSVFTFERPSRAAAAAAGGAGDDDEDEEEKPKKGLLGGVTAANPNLVKKQDKMMKVKDMDGTAEVDPHAGMNRKEREAIEAARRKEEYQKRHMAGETEQAKKELAMLALVRARREAARLKREAEGRKPGWTEHGIDDNEGSGSSDDDSSDDEDDAKKKPAPTPEATAIAAKKKAAAAGPPEGAEAASASDGPPKLKSMDIKKMNGDALKEALKERGLDIQGQKKDLMKRLLDFEAARA